MGPTISLWKKFSEIVDPKLKGEYIEEELKRVVFIGLICAHNKPDKRPTMMEVVELPKIELEERFADIENDEMFNTGRAADEDFIPADRTNT